MDGVLGFLITAGGYIPISEADAHAFAAYVQDVKQKSEEIFVSFKKLCEPNTVCFFLQCTDTCISNRYAKQNTLTLKKLWSL
jgi:hypothetical protein